MNTFLSAPGIIEISALVSGTKSIMSLSLILNAVFKDPTPTLPDLPYTITSMPFLSEKRSLELNCCPVYINVVKDAPFNR